MEKRRYIRDGIKFYNKFLKKNLRMRMNNLDKINSKILTNSSENLTHTAESMLLFLEKGHELELAKYLNEKIENNTPILKIEHISQQIKDYFPFIISTITAIVTLLSFVLGYFLTTQPQN